MGSSIERVSVDRKNTNPTNLSMKISKNAYDIYAPVSLTNEIPPLNISGIRNRQLDLEWAKDLIGTTKVSYVDPQSIKTINGVRSVNYKPEYLKFYDTDAQKVVEGFLQKNNFDLSGNFVIENDYLMHEFHKYLYRLYPEHQNTLQTLTKNERQDYFNEVGSMIHSYWDSSRLIYENEEELLYLQHKLYTNLNCVRENCGTAKNYELLLRLIGIKWAYSDYKIFEGENSVGIPTLKEDVVNKDIITDLIYYTEDTVIIGDTLRILQDNDLQSPFRATSLLNIVDNINSFREFQISENPLKEAVEKLNKIYMYGSIEENRKTIGTVSPNTTLEQIVENSYLRDIPLYAEPSLPNGQPNPAGETDYLMETTDGYGILPFKVKGGIAAFEAQGVNRISNTYLRTLATLGKIVDPKEIIVKTGDPIYDENFLEKFKEIALRAFNEAYSGSNDYALKNKIEGVYRLADNNFIGELEFVLSDPENRRLVRALVRNDFLQTFASPIKKDDLLFSDVFEAVSDPKDAGDIILRDGLYLYQIKVHLFSKINTDWRDTIVKKDNVKILPEDSLTIGADWEDKWDATWIEGYEPIGANTVSNIIELKDISQSIVGTKIIGICTYQDVLKNTSSETILVTDDDNVQFPIKQLKPGNIASTFGVSTYKQEDYAKVLFKKLDIANQAMNKIDCTLLTDGNLRTKDTVVSELIKLKGQLTFGLHLQGENYFGTLKSSYVQNEFVILEVKELFPEIDFDKKEGDEYERFVYARQSALKTFDELYETTLKTLGEEKAALFQTYRLMAEDTDFEELAEICSSIKGVDFLLLSFNSRLK